MTGTRTGLVGHPVSHSKSPIIHEYWIKHYGLSATYELIDLPCEELATGIRRLKDEGFHGFNVTVPHKMAVMKLCDEVDMLARIVGAVNTVKIKDGRLYGTNTDVFGFTENLKAHVPDFDFSLGPALVLGAGGAARAVVQGLLMEGVPEIWLSNRTASKAEALIEHSSEPGRIRRLEWNSPYSSEDMSQVHMVINTTSLGMTGKPPLEVSLDGLSQDALVYDIVYAPLMTELLKDSRRRGNRIVTGIGMLLHQARPGFKLWHGVMPEVTDELTEMVGG